jgi:hypothetical protein
MFYDFIFSYDVNCINMYSSNAFVAVVSRELQLAGFVAFKTNVYNVRHKSTEFLYLNQCWAMLQVKELGLVYLYMTNYARNYNPTPRCLVQYPCTTRV